MEWIIALVSLAIGAGGGFLLARSGDADKKRAESLQNELDSINTELNEYRGRVNQHFSRTAELVDALAANSRAIYEHLTEGSQSLCDTDVIKVSNDRVESLSAQLSSPPAAKTDHVAAAPLVDAPDEGWYEILPETEERLKEGSVH